MKKVLAIALSLGSFSAVFAQPNRQYKTPVQNDKNSRYEAPKQDNKQWDNNRNAVVYSRNNQQDNRFSQLNSRSNQQDDRRMSDRERQVEIDRINHDYDRRVVEYRNNRNMNTRDRDYQIQVIEKERNSKLKSFGAGVLLGGLLGVVLSR